MSRLHPVTLAFDDAALETAFLEQTQPSRVRDFRIGFGLSILVWLAFAGALSLTSWQRDTLVYGALFGMVPYLGVGLLVVRQTSPHRLQQFVSASGNALAGTFAVWGSYHLPSNSSASPVIFVGIFACFLLGLRFYAAATSVLVYGSFAMICNLLWRTPDEAVFDAFLMGGGAGTATLGAWLLESAERRRWLAERKLEAAHQRGENLLRELLPAPIVARLHRGETTIADNHESLSALFADIVGFTPLAQSWEPARLVALLDTLFREMDAIADRHGVEKVKTIGDAYMAVAGAPTPAPDHAERIANLAVDMLAAIDGFETETGHTLKIRIGLHTGPAVSGVIATTRRAWDVWGDTINIASRMESHGVPGRIHVSDAFRDALGDGWTLEERGVVEVKGKGAMATWFLIGREPLR